MISFKLCRVRAITALALILHFQHMTSKPKFNALLFEGRKYYALLASVMSLTAFAPLVEHHFYGRVLIGALAIFALISATMATDVGKRLAQFAIVLAVLNALVWTSSLFAVNAPLVSPRLQSLAYVLTLAFVVVICLIMLKDIFSNEVNGNRVAGAICVYLMVGFAFAIIHMLVLNNDPFAYKDTSGDQLNNNGQQLSGRRLYPLFVYFSFCTLSTVGYGDIVPVSRLARTMAWLEAVGGQIYLTVLVARLVGLHIATATAGQASRGSKETSLLTQSNSEPKVPNPGSTEAIGPAESTDAT